MITYLSVVDYYITEDEMQFTVKERRIANIAARVGKELFRSCPENDGAQYAQIIAATHKMISATRNTTHFLLIPISINHFYSFPALGHLYN